MAYRPLTSELTALEIKWFQSRVMAIQDFLVQALLDLTKLVKMAASVTEGLSSFGTTVFLHVTTDTLERHWGE